VLKQPLDQEINAVRASRKINIPVVMAREEVAQIIALMEGAPQLVVKLLYGSGLRIAEAAGCNWSGELRCYGCCSSTEKSLILIMTPNPELCDRILVKNTQSTVPKCNSY